MKKPRNITINVNNEELILEEQQIKFYKKETNKNKVEKNEVQKFFANLIKMFKNE